MARWRVSRAALLGLLGAVLLGAGCFAPIGALPGGGSATLLGGSSIPARMLLVGAASSVVLVLLSRRRALVLTGAFSSLMLLFEFLPRQATLLSLPATGSPADTLAASLTHEWGWGLLVIGTAFLFLASLLPARKGSRRR